MPDNIRLVDSTVALPAVEAPAGNELVRVIIDPDSSPASRTMSTAQIAGFANVGGAIHGAAGKATPVDADTLALIDSAASNILKKATWANIKATLKTYFDPLYASAAQGELATGAAQRASNLSDLANVLTARTNLKIVTLTQSAYDALDPPDADTLYYITDAE